MVCLLYSMRFTTCFFSVSLFNILSLFLSSVSCSLWSVNFLSISSFILDLSWIFNYTSLFLFLYSLISRSLFLNARLHPLNALLFSLSIQLFISEHFFPLFFCLQLLGSAVSLTLTKWSVPLPFYSLSPYFRNN